MQINETEMNGVAVVAAVGSIDALTADELARALAARIRAGAANVVLDMSGVGFMSSAGLRALLATLKESRASGGDLRLAAAQPGVEKVLKMSGFTNILKTYKTAADAVASFAG